MIRPKVLVVEDEPGTRLIVVNLIQKSPDFSNVHEAATRDEALNSARGVRPDLIVLDLNLGERLDGLRVCRAIRADPATAGAAIIILTGEETSDVELALFEAGADDFIKKRDFSPDLLKSRIKAVMRRTGVNGSNAIVHGPLRLDTERREVLLEGRHIDLTPGEFDILERLVKNKDRAMARCELLGLEESKGDGESRCVDVHMVSLRRKLQPHDWLIQTVLNVGYRVGTNAAEQN